MSTIECYILNKFYCCTRVTGKGKTRWDFFFSVNEISFQHCYQLASVSHLFQQYCDDGLQGCRSDTLQRSYAVFYSLTLGSFIYSTLLCINAVIPVTSFPRKRIYERPRVESILNFNWLPLCLTQTHVQADIIPSKL